MNFRKLHIIKRLRVENVFINIFEYPITYIFASGGYGKTTSVFEFLRNCNDVYSEWFCISDFKFSDINLHERFYNLLENCFNISLNHKFIDYDNLLNTLNSAVKKETVIIIDDWHLNKSEKLALILNRIGTYCINKLHIVILSRNLPDICFQTNPNCFFID